MPQVGPRFPPLRGALPEKWLWVGAPPILVHFSGDWDAHWGYGILPHGQVFLPTHPQIGGGDCVREVFQWLCALGRFSPAAKANMGQCGP